MCVFQAMQEMKEKSEIHSSPVSSQPSAKTGPVSCQYQLMWQFAYQETKMI